MRWLFILNYFEMIFNFSRKILNILRKNILSHKEFKQNFKNVIKLLLICVFLFIISYNLLSKKRSTLTKSVLRDFSKCVPAKNIAYLKVHKAASSTVQNMLFRYGVKHKLHFALPKFRNYFGSGIPFNSSMIPKNLIGNFDVNIFAIHTQWNYNEVKNLMPKGTIFIASVREPTHLFESLFKYLDFERETGLSLEKYVKETPPNAERVRGYLGFNQMAFDFGLLADDIQNETAVMTLIEKADKYFDLVLVVEKFEESLILLRHILCWSIEDVVSLKINSRADSLKSHLNNELTEILRDRLSADYLIYNHFKKKLERAIADFGEQNMAREKAELEEAVQRVIKKCNLKLVSDRNLVEEFNMPFSDQVMAVIGDTEKEYCKHFILSEIAFIEEIRRNQRLEVMKKFGFISSLDDYVPVGAVRLDKIQPETLKILLKTRKKNLNKIN